MSILDEHLNIKKLVELGIVIPGIINGNVGDISYSPISIEDYLERIKNNDLHDLAYNTRTMGRGIFTLESKLEKRDKNDKIEKIIYAPLFPKALLFQGNREYR